MKRIALASAFASVLAGCTAELSEEQVAVAQSYAARHGVQATCGSEPHGQKQDYSRCTVLNSNGVEFQVDCPTFRRADNRPVQCNAVRD